MRFGTMIQRVRKKQITSRGHVLLWTPCCFFFRKSCNHDHVVLPTSLTCDLAHGIAIEASIEHCAGNLVADFVRWPSCALKYTLRWVCGVRRRGMKRQNASVLSRISHEHCHCGNHLSLRRHDTDSTTTNSRST